MQIISADERMRERHGAKVVQLGPPGVGKTYSVRTLDVTHTLYVDIEAGDQALLGVSVPTARIRTWKELRDLACRIAGPDESFAPGMCYSPAHHEAVGGKLEDVDQYETVNDLAEAIEKVAGGYYTGKELKAAAAKAKEFGEQSGYAKAKREASGPPEFYDGDSEPRWYEIARFIDERKSRLNGWERGFVEGDANRGSLVVNMAKFGSPTPKQTKHVLSIFIKLGGTVPPEVVRRYR